MPTHRLRVVASCLCFSDCLQSSPRPRGSHEPPILPDPSPHWSPYFLKKPWPCHGVLVWRDRRGPGTSEPPHCRKPAGAGCPGLAVTPGALESWISMGLIPGAEGTSPASISPLSLVWILPLAKAEGPAVVSPHYLSLSCMPTSHTHLRTKACTVCTPLAWPLTSPGQSGCLRKEGPASCCWC